MESFFLMSSGWRGVRPAARGSTPSGASGLSDGAGPTDSHSYRAWDPGVQLASNPGVNISLRPGGKENGVPAPSPAPTFIPEEQGCNNDDNRHPQLRCPVWQCHSAFPSLIFISSL